MTHTRKPIGQGRIRIATSLIVFSGCGPRSSGQSAGLVLQTTDQAATTANGENVAATPTFVEWGIDHSGRLRHVTGWDDLRRVGPLEPANPPSCSHGGGLCVRVDPCRHCGMTYVCCVDLPDGTTHWRAIPIPPH